MHALLTTMDQPLGRTVGNALEVAESIACLRGEGPADVMELVYALGAEMLILGERAKSGREAREQLETAVRSGAALAKFRDIVVAQGGDVSVIDNPERLPRAKLTFAVKSPRAGVVHDVSAMEVALAALRLGAGRAKAEDTIDPAVGVSNLVKIGERIAAGDVLGTIHANDPGALDDVREMLAKAIVIADSPITPPPLIAETIR
jgi:thymidine phosphorylase